MIVSGLLNARFQTQMDRAYRELEAAKRQQAMDDARYPHSIEVEWTRVEKPDKPA